MSQASHGQVAARSLGSRPTQSHATATIAAAWYPAQLSVRAMPFASGRSTNGLPAYKRPHRQTSSPYAASAPAAHSHATTTPLAAANPAANIQTPAGYQNTHTAATSRPFGLIQNAR